MKIQSYYTPPGFERRAVKGGVIFIKMDVKDDGVKIIEPSYSRTDPNAKTQIVKIPRQASKLNGFISLIRTSENYYQITAFNGQIVTQKNCRSIKEFASFCEEFFT